MRRITPTREKLDALQSRAIHLESGLSRLPADKQPRMREKIAYLRGAQQALLWALELSTGIEDHEPEASSRPWPEKGA